MIDGLLGGGVVGKAVNLFREMEKNGCPPNECTYNTMIRGCIKNHEISRALQLRHEMVAKGFSADASTAELFVKLVACGKLNSSLQPVTQRF